MRSWGNNKATAPINMGIFCKMVAEEEASAPKYISKS